MDEKLEDEVVNPVSFVEKLVEGKLSEGGDREVDGRLEEAEG